MPQPGDEHQQPPHGGGMASRGLTRPMQQSNQSGQDTHAEPYTEARWDMLRRHHAATLWIYWVLIILGLWMVLAPCTFGYLNPAEWVQPSGGRGVWFSDQTHDSLRARLMTGSDVICGLLLVVFGWRSLLPGRPVSLWVCCGVGVWLNAAPLLFWAPTAAGYLNDTVVGVLVIALTILIPGMPSMILYMKMGPPTPPGWSYNPSSWPQRWIMIVTGLAGWLVSRYLATYQLGYIDHVWDPFFGDSSRQILNSDLSHTWPISDAGLGAFSYTFEFLMGFMGSPSRWRTMPWMVTFFGILVIPLGLTHILLVISQPLIVGTWCTFCLVAAAIMLPMIPLEVDEVIAMGQHLAQSRRAGDSVWRAFWKGGSVTDGQTDDRTPPLIELPRRPGAVLRSSVWGMSAPWTLALSALLGVVLMCLPALLNSSGIAADINHLAGALIVTVSVIAMGEVVRIGRWLNVIPGIVVVAGALFAGNMTFAGRLLGVVLGLTVMALAVPRGLVRERFGSWDRWVR